MANGNVIGVGLPKPYGVHIMPPQNLYARHRAMGFSVCHAGFGLALVQFFPVILLFLSLGMGMLTLYHCILEVYNFLCDFTEAHDEEFALCLRRDFKFGL
jgi:hypothetical protein